MKFEAPTLVIREVPLLKLGLLDLEVVGDRRGLAILGDGEGKLLIKGKPDSFGSVFRLMNFETDIEVLTSEEVGPVTN